MYNNTNNLCVYENKPGKKSHADLFQNKWKISKGLKKTILWNKSSLVDKISGPGLGKESGRPGPCFVPFSGSRILNSGLRSGFQVPEINYVFSHFKFKKRPGPQKTQPGPGISNSLPRNPETRAESTRKNPVLGRALGLRSRFWRQGLTSFEKSSFSSSFYVGWFPGWIWNPSRAPGSKLNFFPGRKFRGRIARSVSEPCSGLH